MNIERKVIFYKFAESEIRKFSGTGMYSYIDAVNIGRDVMSCEEPIAISKDHEFAGIGKPIREKGFREDRLIVIGDDVWIGTKVILLPDVRIGRGSVIGAGSILAKDVTPYYSRLR